MKRFLQSSLTVLLSFILVISCDENNKLVEKDQNENIKNSVSITGEASHIFNASAVLSGYVNTKSIAGDVIYGIVLSTDTVSTGVELIAKEIDSNNKYTVLAMGLQKGTTYYYHSFVKYGLEYHSGEIKTFQTTNETGTPEYVDLGLSVLWATFNVGASKPEEYGDYYAWGEVETKSCYTLDTYKYWVDSLHSISKYCTDDIFADGKTILEPEDDVAHIEWQEDWRMPTVEELTELINNCTWTFTSRNGVKGYEITSNIYGYTDRSIFLPAGGWRNGSDFCNVSTSVEYWSSSTRAHNDFNEYAYAYDSCMLNLKNRENGRLIRPVQTSENYGGYVRSTDFIPETIRNLSDATIFYNALVATRLRDSLEFYIDPEYPIQNSECTITGFNKNGTSSVTVDTPDGAESVVYPEKRMFKYTMFIVSDQVLSNYGIYNLEDLRSYAQRVYPEGSGFEDSDRNSSLNKLISYHILPSELTPRQLNAAQNSIIANRKYLDELDVEDFYETLLSHSIMRISTAYNGGTNQGTYINRKGTDKLGITTSGAKISTTDGLKTIPVNGCWYYIDKLLCYDDQTRNALNTRMRIMAPTLSPDFINSEARGRLYSTPADKYVVGFRSGFCKNFTWTDGTKLYVKYRDVASPSLYGDELMIGGAYNLELRLPPVPKDGRYEIRIWNNSKSYPDMSTCQFYFADESKQWIQCQEPVDFGITGSDSRIGFVKDSEFDGLSPQEKEEAIKANDQAMRSKGYMKSPDIYLDNRNNPDCYRKIITVQDMQTDKDYYLRLYNTSERNGLNFSFSFIEIVPESVYSGASCQEDKH